MDNIKSLFIIPTFTQKQHDLYEKHDICGKEFPLEMMFESRINSEIDNIYSHFPINIPESIILELNKLISAHYTVFISSIKTDRIRHAKYGHRSHPQERARTIINNALESLHTSRDNLKQLIIKEHINAYNELMTIKNAHN